MAKIFIDKNRRSQEECILRDLNSNRVLVIRLARTNRNMVFRYTYKTTGETFDIVISNEELKAA